MKICHLSTVHDATDTRVFHRECRSLARAGFDTVLIAPGEQDELRDGVRIRVIRAGLSRILRMLTSVWRVFRIASEERADIYHLHDPELLPVGFVLKLLGKRVVFDVHDYPWYMFTGKEYLPSWARLPIAIFVTALLQAGARIFDRMITVTDEIQSKFPPGTCELVRSYPDLSEYHIASVPPPMTNRPAAFLFAGVLREVSCAREMVQALEHVPDAELLIVGRIYPRDLERELEQQPTWGRVRCHGWIAPSEVRRVASRVRAGLCLFHPSAQYRDAAPRKLFEYLASGLPVVVSDLPAYRRLLEPWQCALFVTPGDVRELGLALAWLLDNPEKAAAMGRGGRNAVETAFNWAPEFKTLLRVYSEILPSPQAKAHS